MTIHDSLIPQWQPGAKIMELMKVLRNTAPKLGLMVPVRVEFCQGTNWSEASYGSKVVI